MLEKEHSNWESFFRNSKLILLVVILFQFLVFPQMLHRYSDLDKLQKEQVALKSIRSEVESIPNHLRANIADFRVELQNTMVKLLDKLKTLEKQHRDKYKKTPLPIDPDGIDFPVSLTENNKKEIDEVCINPLKEYLVASKKKWLWEPFVKSKTRLEKLLDDNTSTMTKYGIDVELMKHDLANAEHSLAVPLTIPDITRDYYPGSKVAAGSATEQNLKYALGDVVENMKMLSDRITPSIDQSSLQAKRIDEQIRELEKKLADETKGIPFLAIDPYDTLLYYPVGLACVAAYLLWTYLSLRNRTNYILSNGLFESSKVNSLEIIDLKRYSDISSSQGRQKTLFCASVLFAMLSAFWIFSVVQIAKSGIVVESRNLVYFGLFPASGVALLVVLGVMLKSVLNVPQAAMSSTSDNGAAGI